MELSREERELLLLVIDIVDKRSLLFSDTDELILSEAENELDELDNKFLELISNDEDCLNKLREKLT